MCRECMGETGAGLPVRQPQPSSAEQHFCGACSSTAAGGLETSCQDTDAPNTPAAVLPRAADAAGCWYRPRLEAPACADIEAPGIQKKQTDVYSGHKSRVRPHTEGFSRFCEPSRVPQQRGRALRKRDKAQDHSIIVLAAHIDTSIWCLVLRRMPVRRI